jgi:hypothetical protein
MYFEISTPAKSRWTVGPAGLSTMSTQRRESSSTLATITRRRGARCGSRYCWQRTNCTHREGADGLVGLAPVTRPGHAIELCIRQRDIDRPFKAVEPVTISLQKNPRFVRPISHDSPLPRTASLGQLRPQGTNRYSPPLISVLSGSARFHLALPQAPAGTSGIRVAVYQRQVSKAALFSKKRRPEDCRRRHVYSGSARRRWAERYDGQGNLHFKHAA